MTELPIQDYYSFFGNHYYLLHGLANSFGHFQWFPQESAPSTRCVELVACFKLQVRLLLWLPSTPNAYTANIGIVWV